MKQCSYSATKTVRAVCTRSWLAAALLLASVLALGGCSLLSRPGAMPLVTMRTPIPRVALCEQPVKAQIIVSLPDAGAGLRTDRIALIFDEREIKYLATAKWDASAPTLLQRQLVRYLDAAGCFSGVGAESAGLSASYRLESDLQRLHFSYSGGERIPSAEILLRLTLVDIDTGRVMGGELINYTEKCAGSDLDSLLDAMDKAVYRAMLDAVRWSSELVRNGG